MKIFLVNFTTYYDGYEWGGSVLVRANTEEEAKKYAEDNGEGYVNHADIGEEFTIDTAEEVTEQESEIFKKAHIDFMN